MTLTTGRRPQAPFSATVATGCPELLPCATTPAGRLRGRKSPAGELRGASPSASRPWHNATQPVADMHIVLLIDSIMRQTTVLIAQLSTSARARVPPVLPWPKHERAKHH